MKTVLTHSTSRLVAILAAAPLAASLGNGHWG